MPFLCWVSFFSKFSEFASFIITLLLFKLFSTFIEENLCIFGKSLETFTEWNELGFVLDEDSLSSFSFSFSDCSDCSDSSDISDSKEAEEHSSSFLFFSPSLMVSFFVLLILFNA